MSTNDQPSARPTSEELREHAWKYFSLHAEQRLRMFHFFLLLVTVIFAGYFAYLKDAKHPCWISPVGLLLSFVAFIFWKLENRTRELIKHAEVAIKFIETDAVPDPLKLFSEEEKSTGNKRKEDGFVWYKPKRWFGHFTYSDAFRCIFAAFIFVGLCMFLIALFLPATEPSNQPPQQQFFIGMQPPAPVRQP